MNKVATTTERERKKQKRRNETKTNSQREYARSVGYCTSTGKIADYHIEARFVHNYSRFKLNIELIMHSTSLWPVLIGLLQSN